MLVFAANMEAYFKDALSEAIRRTSHRVTDDAQAYLIGLLSEFSRAEHVYAGVDRGDKPSLALLYSRALEADHEESVRIYRHLGDSSLYFLGFFNDAVGAQTVDPSYYMSMGETAYSSVSHMIRDAGTRADLYLELAARFSDLVELLHWVSVHGENLASQDEISNADVLKLLARYERTGAAELAGVLKKLGVKPGGPGYHN